VGTAKILQRGSMANDLEGGGMDGSDLGDSSSSSDRAQLTSAKNQGQSEYQLPSPPRENRPSNQASELGTSSEVVEKSSEVVETLGPVSQTIMEAPFLLKNGASIMIIWLSYTNKMDAPFFHGSIA
jgi:hypothetical protein